GADLAQLLQGERNLLLLALELGDARAPLGERRAELLHMVGVRRVEVEQLLAAQNELQPRPVAGPIDAVSADALGAQQPLILVKPDGARRNAELAGQIADGIEALATFRRFPDLPHRRAIYANVRHMT